MQFAKHFTVTEANRLLDELRPLLLEIRAARDRLLQAWPRAREVVSGCYRNGGGKAAAAYIAELSRLNVLLRRLSEMGVLLKDIDRGLVDFPHLREGREVFLCWELGEREVCYWHDLESGYAGRQPL